MPTSIEIATLALAKANAHDGRGSFMSTADKNQAIQAFAEALHAASTAEDVSRAVAEHYSNTSTRIMVSHINALTAKYRAERVAKAPLVYPDGLGDNPRLESTWIGHYRDAIGQGATPDQADTYAWGKIGKAPPDRQLTAAPPEFKAQVAKFKTQFGKEPQ